MSAVSTSFGALDLDLDVFSGPFDLLMALVLREEVDLLELDLAAVVLAYLAHIEARGELDLETATEFIVLIASLLELKSRLMLPEEEVQELRGARARGGGGGAARADALRPSASAARAATCSELLAAQAGVGFRAAPVPRRFRRAAIEQAAGSADPGALGEAMGGLLRTPPRISLRHMLSPRVTVGRASRAPASPASARALQLR